MSEGKGVLRHTKFINLSALLLVLFGCLEQERSPSDSEWTLHRSGAGSRTSSGGCLDQLLLELDGRRGVETVGICYPPQAVLIAKNLSAPGDELEMLDAVYARCSTRGAFSGLKPRMISQGDVRYYGSSRSAVKFISECRDTLAVAYWAIPRIRQEILGGWQGLRPLGVNSFWYTFAPQDPIVLEVSAAIARVAYFSDRVVVVPLDAEQAAGLEVSFVPGFDGASDAILKALAPPLSPGETLRGSFPFNDLMAAVDLRTYVSGWEGFEHRVPVHHLFGGLNFSYMMANRRPARVDPGPTYDGLTYRSRALREVLGYSDPFFPPSDDEWPSWAIDEFYKLLPDWQR